MLFYSPNFRYHTAMQKTSSFYIEDEFLNNFTSKHTRIAYHQDLTSFLSWLNVHFPKIENFPQILRSHIVDYRNYMSGSPKKGHAFAPKTIARKLASLSSYFDYLTEKGVISQNLTHSIKRPRREVLAPTHALNKVQIIEIFEMARQNENSGKMHHALLATFFTTGLRKSEILSLKIKNLREINEHKYLEYMGKGGKVGQKLLHPYCVASLEEYILWSQSKDTEIGPESWLFRPTRNPSNPNHLDRPLNPKTINEIFKSYAQKIGLNFQISPHSARASFISELLNIGIDIYSVAKEVNHASVKTTELYDKRRKNFIESPILKLKID